MGWHPIHSLDGGIWSVCEDVYSRESRGGCGDYEDETCGLGGFD